MTEQSASKIPPGLPKTLRDLHQASEKAARTVYDLHLGSTPEAFDRAADELYAAFAIARDLARPAAVTGCHRHPQGATDPNPPDGWGKCLICNTNQRRATRPADPATQARQALGRLNRKAAP